MFLGGVKDEHFSYFNSSCQRRLIQASEHIEMANCWTEITYMVYQQSALSETIE